MPRKVVRPVAQRLLLQCGDILVIGALLAVLVAYLLRYFELAKSCAKILNLSETSSSIQNIQEEVSLSWVEYFKSFFPATNPDLSKVTFNDPCDLPYILSVIDWAAEYLFSSIETIWTHAIAFVILAGGVALRYGQTLLGSTRDFCWFMTHITSWRPQLCWSAIPWWLLGLLALLCVIQVCVICYYCWKLRRLPMEGRHAEPVPGVCSPGRHSSWPAMVRLSWRRVAGCLICLAFLVSLPWEYLRLYQVEIAKKASVTLQGMPPECEPRHMSVLQTLKMWLSWHLSWDHAPCEQYHQALLVDPLWEVTPMMVLSSLATRCLTRPLEMAAATLGTCFRLLFREIPALWQPVVMVMLVVVVTLLGVMTCGYRVAVPFLLHVEPSKRRTPVVVRTHCFQASPSGGATVAYLERLAVGDRGGYGGGDAAVTSLTRHHSAPH